MQPIYRYGPHRDSKLLTRYLIIGEAANAIACDLDGEGKTSI